MPLFPTRWSSGTRSLVTAVFQRPFRYWLMTLLCTLGISSVGAGYVASRLELARTHLQASNELHQVALLKAAWLADWRQERMTDALVLARDIAADQETLDRLHPQANRPESLDAPAIAVLDARLNYGDYDAVYAFGERGALTRSTPVHAPPVSRQITQAVLETTRTHAPAFIDFYRSDHDGLTRVGVSAPILDTSNQVRGTVVLSIDVSRFIFGYVAAWPGRPSATSDTVLVRRDGAHIIYLMPPRFDTGGSLTLRLPLGDVRLLAAQALLGRAGPLTGKDYRGVEVVGAAAPVVGSSWFVIVKRDLSEIHAEPLRQFQAIASVILPLAGLNIGLVLFVWRTARRRRRQATRTALLESESQYRALFEQNSIPMLILSEDADQIVNANLAAVAFYGWDGAILQTMRLSDLSVLDTEIDQVIAHLPVTPKLNRVTHRAASGQHRMVEQVVSPITLLGTPRALATILDVTERIAAERSAAIASGEKDALLREVHHRVKNNLQVVGSLLRLEAGRTTDATVQSVMGDMQRRILSMGLLHETLYRSERYASVDLADYLKRLATQLFGSIAPRTGISLALDVTPLRVDLDTALPCAMLVTELMSNSLKHAFPDNGAGQVLVSLGHEAGSDAVRLTVADTGIGFPMDIEARRRTGIGIELVVALARQLQGSLAFSQGPGATVSVVFMPGKVPQAPAEG